MLRAGDVRPLEKLLSYTTQSMPCSRRSFSPSVPLGCARLRAAPLRKNSPIAKSTPPVRSPAIAWPAMV